MAHLPHTGTNDTSLSPIAMLREATRRVPVVRFAFGVVGFAAAASIIVGFLGSAKTTVILVALTFVGTLLTVVLSRVALAKNKSVRRAGDVLLWAVILFFCIFLGFTVSAFSVGSPRRWGQFIGIEPATNQIDSACHDNIDLMWSRFLGNQLSDAVELARQVEKCAPVESANLQGAVAFYTEQYFNAVDLFKRAHDLDPTNDVITRNLADAYIEAGRIGDAIRTYDSIKNQGSQLWNYKKGRALLYDGLYSDAQKLLAPISTSFNEDGNNPGKARILEAAALVGMARSLTDEAQKKKLLAEAEQKFKSGVAMDPYAWKQILTVTWRTQNEGFEVVKKEIGPLLDSWLS